MHLHTYLYILMRVCMHVYVSVCIQITYICYMFAHLGHKCTVEVKYSDLLDTVFMRWCQTVFLGSGIFVLQSTYKISCVYFTLDSW